MKLSQVRMMALSASTAAALTTTVNDWIATNGRERTVLNVAFIADSGVLTACITYTE